MISIEIELVFYKDLRFSSSIWYKLSELIKLSEILKKKQNEKENSLKLK